MKPNTEQLFAALEAGWPPAATRTLGPFTLRQGKGGGQRVSATTVSGPFTAADLAKTLAAMAQSDEPKVFQILPSQSASAALDSLLEAKGWRVHDPVSLYMIQSAQLAALDLAPARGFAIWPPLAIQREIWAANGIGPDRLAVMERAAVPRSAILGRLEDRSAGVAYVAAANGIAGLHALAVSPDYRRNGIARLMMIRAARWALEQGAEWLALAVTRQNAPARALYTSLGMEEVEQYHYRIPREDPV